MFFCTKHIIIIIIIIILFYHHHTYHCQVARIAVPVPAGVPRICSIYGGLFFEIRLPAEKLGDLWDWSHHRFDFLFWTVWIDAWFLGAFSGFETETSAFSIWDGHHPFVVPSKTKWRKMMRFPKGSNRLKGKGIRAVSRWKGSVSHFFFREPNSVKKLGL